MDKKCLADSSREFGSRLGFSNGHPNQRNAKTAVSATSKNNVEVKKQSRVGRKSKSS